MPVVASSEAHVDLSARCPRCAGQLVLRVLAEERGQPAALLLTLDTACVSCGVSPWGTSDQRTVWFSPGATIAEALGGVEPGAQLALAGGDLQARLSAAQSRIDSLLRRCELLEQNLALSQREVQRATATRARGEVETSLRGEITRLEGALADARAEVRKAEEATRGEVKPGKRPIEME